MFMHPCREYKDSGIDWIGLIPCDWGVKKLKHCGIFFGGGTPTKDRLDFWSGTIPWVSPKDMKAALIEETEDHITEDAVLESATQIVPPGAIVMVVRSGILKHSIPVGMCAKPMAINQDMKAIVAAPSVDPEFLLYLITGCQRQFLAMWRKQGATVESIEHEFFANTQIPVPPLGVQKTMVAFLRRKTTIIDDLIAKKERQIRLLQEKCQSIISQIVVRGLNEAVRLRATGIDWLAFIPAHWELVPLKFLVKKIEQGWSPQCESRPAETDEWGVLKVGCVNQLRFNEAENKALPEEISPLPEYEVKPGEILVSRANTAELLGSASLISQVRPRLMLCDKLYRLIPASDRVAAGFLVWFLRSSSARFIFERDATGASSSMKNIGQDTVKNLLIPTPPRPEQNEIMRFANNLVSQTETQIEAIESQLKLLSEYRSTLLFDVVTGRTSIGTTCHD